MNGASLTTALLGLTEPTPGYGSIKVLGMEATSIGVGCELAWFSQYVYGYVYVNVNVKVYVDVYIVQTCTY